MSDLEQALDQMLSGNIENMQLQLVLDRMFEDWDAKKANDRFGLHASGVLAPDQGRDRFCYRQQVLNKYFKPTPQKMPVRALRIFLEGWYVHTKWQRLFRDAGVAIEIEKTHVDPVWNLYHTPDAIINVLGQEWVVEIKSMKEKVFLERTRLGPPSNGVNQCQLYMYLTKRTKGFVLAENKNTQDFAVWVVEYDPHHVQPYIDRLDTLMKLFDVYERTGRLPKRTCISEDDIRAKNCPLKDACFATDTHRPTLLRELEEVRKQEIAAQQNSSPMHEDNDAA